MRSFIIFGALTFGLVGCTYEPTQLPRVTELQNVADQSVISPIANQSPLAGYTYRGPTGPRDWRSVNEEQSEGN